MRDSFPFLTRLGLRPDAEAKDIRRAYARELKKIDQEADPAGFQELREAYEVALSWHAHAQFEAAHAEEAQQQEVTPPQEPAPASQPEPAPDPELEPAPTPEQDDPYHLADQAYQKFNASIAMLVERKETRHETLWTTVLQRSLDDDRLLNLTARTIFEARLTHELASGWKPGHETLFVVAAKVFEWERDRRRILQFGEAGAMVNRAIDEWKLFESLPPNSIAAFKQLINYVRNLPEPKGIAGRSDLTLFHQMAGTFHTWLSLIVDRQALENWSEAAHEEVQRNGPEPAVPMQYMEHPEQPKPESSWKKPAMLWPLFFVLFMVLRSCFNIIEDENRAQHLREQVSEQKRVAPQAEHDKEPSREQIDEIGERIAYKWPASTPPGTYAVEYEVFIDAAGKVLGMNLASSSGNRDYDIAVRKAIRDTARFPRGTKTRFMLKYSVKISKAPQPAGKPATKAQLKAVQDEIYYVAGGNIEDGELRVRYELELNDDGRVIGLKKLKPSRDPNYDEVVADALKETRAFPPGTERKFWVEFSRNVRRL